MGLVTSSAINAKSSIIVGVTIPESARRKITELVRDTETPLLFDHSSRVFYWGALTAKAPRSPL